MLLLKTAAQPRRCGLIQTGKSDIESDANHYGRLGVLSVRKTKGAAGGYRTYLAFQVRGIGGPVTRVRLRLRVTDASSDGGKVYP
ncbi:MAG: hypothetical protein ACREB5_05445, partial [Sphingomonadaceae bacterium]